MNLRGDDALVEALRVLYRELDEQADDLHRLHADRLNCRLGCHDCCRDKLTVFAVEGAFIRHHHQVLLEEGEAHPRGACAFLGTGGACRIYPHRPYVCRTQGLPLRWLDEDAVQETVEYRDICPLNEEGSPVEDLPPEQCWTIGPVEERLRQLQAECGEGELTRVALRDLFRG
jgi:Fe-S-cluster containining protein